MDERPRGRDLVGGTVIADTHDPNDGDLVVGVELEPQEHFLARLWHTEPAMVIGFASALLALLIAYNVPITPDQTVKTIAFVGVAWALVQSWVIRSQVSPVAKVEALHAEADAAILEAYHTGLADAHDEASVIRPSVG